MESKLVDFKEYKDELLDIRNEVFTIEQKVPADLDYDEFDDTSKHVIVYSENSPVATGRILSDGHIGRVAVLKNFRGHGIGRIIIDKLIEYGKAQEYKTVYLGAQLTALGFYERLGFSSYGDMFLDGGLRHIMMKMEI